MKGIFIELCDRLGVKASSKYVTAKWRLTDKGKYWWIVVTRKSDGTTVIAKERRIRP